MNGVICFVNGTTLTFREATGGRMYQYGGVADDKVFPLDPVKVVVEEEEEKMNKFCAHCKQSYEGPHTCDAQRRAWREEERRRRQNRPRGR